MDETAATVMHKTLPPGIENEPPVDDDKPNESEKIKRSKHRAPLPKPVKKSRRSPTGLSAKALL
jgi:hypothetical protein